MDLEVNIGETTSASLPHKFARMLLAATAGFVASVLVEKTYDRVIINRSTSTTTES